MPTIVSADNVVPELSIKEQHDPSIVETNVLVPYIYFGGPMVPIIEEGDEA